MDDFIFPKKRTHFRNCFLFCSRFDVKYTSRLGCLFVWSVIVETKKQPRFKGIILRQNPLIWKWFNLIFGNLNVLLCWERGSDEDYSLVLFCSCLFTFFSEFCFLGKLVVRCFVVWFLIIRRKKQQNGRLHFPKKKNSLSKLFSFLQSI